MRLRSVVSVLAAAGIAAWMAAHGALAQDSARRGPSLDMYPVETPAPERPRPQLPEQEEAEIAPAPAPGCPDTGRKLELIV